MRVRKSSTSLNANEEEEEEEVKGSEGLGRVFSTSNFGSSLCLEMDDLGGYKMWTHSQKEVETVCLCL